MNCSPAPSLRALVAAPIALMFASCTPASDPAEAATETSQAVAIERHPLSGHAVIDVTFVSGDARHLFRVEYPATREDRVKGLTFREKLGPNEAMLFQFDEPHPASFWMRNVPIPLDMVFIGTEGRILNVVANTQPNSLGPYESDGIAAAAIEMPGGRAAELGIGAGDMVEYTLPDLPATPAED